MFEKCQNQINDSFQGLYSVRQILIFKTVEHPLYLQTLFYKGVSYLLQSARIGGDHLPSIGTATGWLAGLGGYLPGLGQGAEARQDIYG